MIGSHTGDQDVMPDRVTTIYVVVANASSLRPWQVLGLGETDFFTHGSFKTRRSAVERARDLNGDAKVQVFATLEEVHRQIYEPRTLFKPSLRQRLK